MRLFPGKIQAISDEIVRSLVSSGDIEVESEAEVRLDLEAVMKQFINTEREITEEAKTRMEAKGLGYGQLGKTKSLVAKERGVLSGEDALPFLVDQFLEILFHSNNVVEVFAEDVDLRKKITPILRKNMDVETELDREVRAKIKNMQEGTGAFEVEYAKVLEQIKRNKGLS
jgi:hypothetical protein